MAAAVAKMDTRARPCVRLRGGGVRECAMCGLTDCPRRATQQQLHPCVRGTYQTCALHTYLPRQVGTYLCEQHDAHDDASYNRTSLQVQVTREPNSLIMQLSQHTVMSQRQWPMQASVGNAAASAPYLQCDVLHIPSKGPRVHHAARQLLHDRGAQHPHACREGQGSGSRGACSVTDDLAKGCGCMRR